jgi:CheY-like chemotaxis protein
MIRAVPEWKDIYLIAATGYSSPRDKQMAMECGFNTLMVKPLELEKLKELLNRPPSAHDEVQTRQ